MTNAVPIGTIPTGGSGAADPVDDRIAAVAPTPIAPWGTIDGGDPVVAPSRR